MIEMKLTRQDKAKSFTVYFKTTEDLRQFEAFVKELVARVKEEAQK